MTRLFERIARRIKVGPRPVSGGIGRRQSKAAGSLNGNGAGSAANFAARRLESWKRIARYLRRDVRTVQRWESTEDLPIHRLQHRKQGSVYAYADELDVWLRDHEAGGNETANRESHVGSRRRAIVAGLFVVLSLVGAAVVYRIVTVPDAGAFSDHRVMLAVLPFENMGAAPEHGYFAAGLTEDLITDLGRVNPEQLGVIARTTVMRYKDTRKSISEIGRELGVDYILEGSVRREGERLRVTAQLIAVNDQTHLWANSYDRRLQDVLNLQAELAHQVAGAIQVELGPARTESGAKAMVNPKAYDLLLRGRYQIFRWTAGGFLKGRHYLGKAVKLDPDLANAWAWLSMANMAIAFYGLEPAGQGWSRSVRAARRALALDPRQGLALVALGWKAYKHDWDWDRADRLFRRAVEASPNSPWPHWGYAQFLNAMGRHEEAIAEARRALRLDPASLYTQFAMHFTLWEAGRYAEALAGCRKTHERLPERPDAFYRCALEVYQRLGQYRKAIEMGAHLAALGTAAGNYYRLELGDHRITSLKRAYREHGAAGYWTWFKELRADGFGHSGPLSRAIAYVQLGQFDRAMAVLEEGFRQHALSMTEVKVEPLLDPLRGDSRFQELVRRMHLQDQRQAGRR